MTATSRDRYLMVLNRHENGETYTAIAKELGISPTRAQQMGAKAARILRCEAVREERRIHRESLPVENPETISDLHLSNLTSIELVQRGLTTINDLTNMTNNELSAVISAEAFTELMRQLDKGGITLREEGAVKHTPENIESMGFSHRTLRLLKIHMVDEFEELIQCTESELLRINTFGVKCLEEVKAKLSEYGYELRKEEE